MAARQEFCIEDASDDDSDLRLSAAQAAAVLEATPATLAIWDERLGCPRAGPDAQGATSYSLHEVMLLRDALQTTFSLPAAAVQVRRALLRRVRPEPAGEQVTRDQPIRAA